MSREHNSNSKLWLLKYIEPEFRRRADMQEVLTNCKDAIFLKISRRMKSEKILMHFQKYSFCT